MALRAALSTGKDSSVISLFQVCKALANQSQMRENLEAQSLWRIST